MVRFRLIAGLIGLLAGPSSLFGDGERDAGFDYEIHEWGVFTAPRGALWLKQDMLREWQSFPAFFHGVLPGRELAYRGPVTKPVIFFHGKGRGYISTSLKFRAGRPLIWWPPAEYPATGLGRLERDDQAAESILRHAFELNARGGTVEALPATHWVQSLRRVKSAPISGYGSFTRLGQQSWNENFLYYDGLMKLPPVPQVARIEEGVIVESDSDHDWLDVLVIDRSLDGNQVTVGRVDKIERGRQRNEIVLQRMGGDGGAEKALGRDLRRQLILAGLHEDEAQSLLEVWSEGLFERVGLTLCYRIPQATYDHWIELKCEPAPRKTVRVGLVVHHHLEPEFEESILKLVDRLGAERTQDRHDAERQLDGIGAPALDVLAEAARSDDPERALRARKILKSVQSGEKLLDLMKRHERHLSQ